MAQPTPVIIRSQLQSAVIVVDFVVDFVVDVVADVVVDSVVEE
jgi:hypothetical protein